MDSSKSGLSSDFNATEEHLDKRNFTSYKLQIVEGMKRMNQDLLQLDKNLKGLADKSGPFKTQLSALLSALPDPNTDFLYMETD